MLTACDYQGNLVNLLEGIPPKQFFTCPACDSPVRLKNGQVMRPHFAHVRLKDCRFYSENESSEHLTLKAQLYQSLSPSETVEIEKVLPQLGQIADLLVNGKLALEVQCSRLSEERLRQRTQAYRDYGFHVIWLLGEKMWLGQRLTSLHKQFLYFSNNMGFHLWELDVKRQQLRLKYLIYEDLHGRVHYLSKVCSFSDDLMTFFRLPYQKQRLASYEVKMDRQIITYIQRQLMARSPFWMRQQEAVYSRGENLLAQDWTDFYPQVRPPQAKQGFCQIRQDLSSNSGAFFQYYKDQGARAVQKLYPPSYYVKMVRKK